MGVRLEPFAQGIVGLHIARRCRTALVGVAVGAALGAGAAATDIAVAPNGEFYVLSFENRTLHRIKPERLNSQ